MDLCTAFTTARLLPVASASETAGRSSTQMDPVMALGKRIRGRDMPVRIP